LTPKGNSRKTDGETINLGLKTKSKDNQARGLIGIDFDCGADIKQQE
jgi:hypothetical protein